MAKVLKTFRVKALASSNLALSASWENANLKRLPRGARRAARLEFERAFLAKRKRIYQRRAKEIFS